MRWELLRVQWRTYRNIRQGLKASQDTETGTQSTRYKWTETSGVLVTRQPKYLDLQPRRL